MSRIASSISRSFETSAIRPVASILRGKDHPEPMKSSLNSASYKNGRRSADEVAGQPEVDDRLGSRLRCGLPLDEHRRAPHDDGALLGHRDQKRIGHVKP